MHGHLDSVQGLVHALAGELDQAERVFLRVQTGAENNRRRIASFGHQALGHVRQSEPEAACDAARSVNLANEDPYPMGLKRTAGVRAGFHPGWATLPRVQELDERLRLLGTARGWT